MSARSGLLAGLAVALALGAGGCGGGGGERAPEPTASEIVRQTIEQTGAQKSFHFQFEIENAPPDRPGLNLTFADGDLVVPDQLHARVAGTLSGISLRSELIFFHDQHYLKDPLTGDWRTLDAETSPIAFFDPARGVLAVVKGAQQLVKSGSEKVDGTDAYRLDGVVRARAITPILGNPPTDLLVDLVLWVGKDDFLLRRIRLLGPVAKDESAEIVRTVEVSRFGEPFTIEPPASAS